MRTCRRSECYIHYVPHFEIQASFSVKSKYLNFQFQVSQLRALFIDLHRIIRFSCPACISKRSAIFQRSACQRYRRN
jgi:hypothetical protein